MMRIICYESLMATSTSYDELKILFCGQFWSAVTQRKIRNDIFRAYAYRQSYVTYFLNMPFFG